MMLALPWLFAMIADPTHPAYGPYRPPSLRRGDRAFCLARDTEVMVRSWTDAPIPWPRCRRLDTRSATSLLVNEELARASAWGSVIS